MEAENFIFCLEAVPDIENVDETHTLKQLERLAAESGLNSIYTVCDTIETFEENLGKLVHDDSNFNNYEILYFVFQGDGNRIQIDGYWYSLDEIAELFEGKLKGKILHFSNRKQLDLTNDEAQFFLDVTRAKAISGYGRPHELDSIHLDKAFFKCFEDLTDVVEIVEELYLKHFALCKLLDFKLYY